MMAVTQALDAGIGAALLGNQRFEGDFLLGDHRFALTNLLVQACQRKADNCALS